MNRAYALLSLALVSYTACGKSHLKGSYTPSRDGNTYLAFVNDRGGSCGQTMVDGKAWPHPVGESAPIDPGQHTISWQHTIPCVGQIQVNIPKGVDYRFEFWEP